MIAYIEGKITERQPDYIVVETGGIGYQVHISLNTFSRIRALENVKIFTHLHIKEDSHTLYGFSEPDERQIFLQLISVSGVGPNTARLLLSSLTATEVRRAILSEDVPVLKGVKGIGPKTAKRIILDLKDKVAQTTDESAISLPSGNNTLKEEAFSALVALGFQKNQVQKLLNSILAESNEIDDVESLIKEALKRLS